MVECQSAYDEERKGIITNYGMSTDGRCGMRPWMHGVMEPSYVHKWNERKVCVFVCVRMRACACMRVGGRGRAHGSCEMLSVLKLLDVHINNQFTATLTHLGTEQCLGTTK